MFLSRLDRARHETQKSPAVSLTSPAAKSSSSASSRNGIPINSSPKQRIIPPRILHELNEYLFDVFDANCMEEYHIMETFESKAMEYFYERVRQEMSTTAPSSSGGSGGGSSISVADAKEAMFHSDVKDGPGAKANAATSKQCKEYGHHEYTLHNEFLQLFESMIDNFLQEQHCTAEDLYEELREYHRKKQMQQNSPTEDIYAKYKTSGYSHETHTTNTATSSNTHTATSLSTYPSMSYDHDDSSSVICVQGDSPSTPQVHTTTTTAQDNVQQQQDALEVLEVLSFYTDFTTWCEMMMENAKHRMKFSKCSSNSIAESK